LSRNESIQGYAEAWRWNVWECVKSSEQIDGRDCCHQENEKGIQDMGGMHELAGSDVAEEVKSPQHCEIERGDSRE